MIRGVITPISIIMYKPVLVCISIGHSVQSEGSLQFPFLVLDWLMYFPPVSSGEQDGCHDVQEQNV